MKFDKKATTIGQQLALLIERGMIVDDHDAANRWLKSISYYRLSAYWLPFEEHPQDGAVRSKRFCAGTHLQTVIDLYVFDRRLRMLLLEAIERVEVHARSRWTYHMVHAHGSHAHLEHSLFGGGLEHAEQLIRLARSVDRSEETFIKYYKKKYSTPLSPPLWAGAELMTLGEFSKWFQATRDNQVKSQVGRELGLPTKEIIESALQTLAYTRNICAHHGRLWNRRLVKRLLRIKRLGSDMILDPSGKETDNRIYNVIVVLLHMLDHQNTDSTLRLRLKNLVEEVSDSQRDTMGFPQNWRTRPIWQQLKDHNQNEKEPQKGAP